MALGEKDVMVIEGIHGLNDRMSEAIPDDYKFRIYISALTQLRIDERNPLSTTDGRLIRRIVRDFQEQRNLREGYHRHVGLRAPGGGEKYFPLSGAGG